MVEATVIVAAWNAEETVTRSIQSALSQRDVAVDVIVIDDKSTDGTADLVEGLAREMGNLRLIRAPENGGPGGARNHGFDRATAPWLAVLDSDDLMREGRLAAMIALAEETGADVVLGNLQRVSPEGEPVDADPYLSGSDFADGVGWDLREYLEGEQFDLKHKSLGYLKPVFRRSYIEAHNLRYKPSLRNGEDTHLILDCLAAGAKVVFSAAPDYLYTVRPGSISYRVNPAHLASVLAADAAFQLDNAGQMTAAITTLFDTRKRSIALMMHSETVLQALKEKKVGRALGHLARHPFVTGRVVAQLVQAAQKRVRPG